MHYSNQETNFYPFSINTHKIHKIIHCMRNVLSKVQGKKKLCNSLKGKKIIFTIDRPIYQNMLLSLNHQIHKIERHLLNYKSNLFFLFFLEW